VLLRQAGDLLATAALVIIDTTNATIEYATAGHPPPLLIDPDGAVTTLHTANSPMLDITAAHQIAGKASFPSGARLIIYTDGLVERHDRPFYVGIDEAVSLLSPLDSALNPGELIDLLVQRLVGEHRDHDDVAVVVVENATQR
jgi:serine phosphatase RsbU (regulator of sigma subunit)